MTKILSILLVLLLAGSLHAKDYFVERDHVSASDSNAGTDPAEPWLTIDGPDPSPLVPGDTVTVNGFGTYDERVTVEVSGTAGNVITYKAATDCVSNNGASIAENCPKVRGFTISSKNYITIQGLEVTTEGMSADGTRPINITTGDNILLLNSYLHDTDASFPCANAGTSSTNIVFRGNNVQYCGVAMDVHATIGGTYNIQTGVNDKISLSVQGGAAQTATLTAGAARTPAQIQTDVTGQITGTAAIAGNVAGYFSVRSTTLGPTSSLEVLSVANDAYTTLGMAVGLGTMVGHGAAFGASGAATHVTDWLIEDNVLSSVGDYITPGASVRLVVRNNTLGPVWQYTNHHVDGLQPAGTVTSLVEGNLFIDNDSSDNHFFLHDGSANDHWIMRYNSFCRSLGGVSQQVADYLYLYNNTLYNNYAVALTGITQLRVHEDSTGNVARNNIFYNAVAPTGDLIYTVQDTSTLDKDYDLWFGSDDPVETNDVNADPLVVNGANCNFQLQAGSPAVDAGGPLTTVHADDTGTGTALVVEDARPFQDGWAGVDPDWIAVGTVGNTVQISSIDYETGTITLANSIERTPETDNVWLFKKSDGVRVLWGAAPDIGAEERGGASAGRCCLISAP